MTEDEAKTKWCPMTRVVADSHGGAWFNHTLHEAGVAAAEDRSTAAPKLSRCIGPACMAWRPGPTEALVLNIADNTRDGGGERLVAAGYTIDAARHYWRKPLPPSGYCGLAGKPT